MNYLIYLKSNGEILRSVSGDIDAVQAQVSEAEDVIEGQGSWVTHKVENGQVVELPAPRVRPGEGFSWSFEAGAWIDDRSLQQAKDLKWAEIKAARMLATTEPIAVDELVFDADEASQARLLAAAQMGSIVGPTWSAVWTLANNSTAVVNPTILANVIQHIGARTEAAFVKARGLREQIDAATTVASVDAVSW